MFQSLGFTLSAFVAARTAVSIAVTAHVLLRKSDVRAELGWIGIAWLSPIVGGPLYFLFRINRVARPEFRPAAANRTLRGWPRGQAGGIAGHRQSC